MLTAVHLDTASHTPIYRQLSDHIRESIRSGNLNPGDRIPPTRELAGQLGLNRATIAAAYELLESEGWIKGHVGRGSFVQPWQNELTPISFASSRPSEELFPLDHFRTVCRQVLDGQDLGAILQLGSPFGYEPLRRWLIEDAFTSGISRGSDKVVITNGCQQALDLIARALIQPGDAVLVEDPVYPGLREAFSRSGARVIGVQVGEDGYRLDLLEHALRRDRPKLVLVTPSFQNPTGASLPLDARHRLIAIVRDAGALLVENAIYAGLRYEGAPLPSLKAMDETGETVQLGSFSKIAFPGLRVGWVLAPTRIAAALAETKQWCDLHSDQLSQAVLVRFAESGLLEQHRKRMIETGALRLAACLEACARHLPKTARFTRPQGGMNLWVTLPAPLDAAELLHRAEAVGVSYLPGRFFSATAEPGCLRLSFAGLNPGKIHRGVSLLGTLFKEELARARLAHHSQPALAMV
ncbi:MAG: PLP-dependent aminotransferase family protein [Acidobacteriia bacterium]|nr:PLP-dependent aminotransferase family protein [Terriglobia bacterium]